MVESRRVFGTFGICALGNGWEPERKALMLATCLKGEAMEVFKTLNVDERKDYQIIKDTLKAAFRAEDFKYTALNEYILEQCFRMRHLNSIRLSLKD